MFICAYGLVCVLFLFPAKSELGENPGLCLAIVYFGLLFKHLCQGFFPLAVASQTTLCLLVAGWESTLESGWKGPGVTFVLDVSLAFEKFSDLC